MIRKLLIPLLLAALVVLISLMGWFSVRMYKMEVENAQSQRFREHENALSLVIWQLETSALSLYNTCLAELSGTPDKRKYVKAEYLLDPAEDWSTETIKEVSLEQTRQLSSSLWDVAQQPLPVRAQEKAPLPKGKSVKVEKELKKEQAVYEKKADDYATRAKNVQKQKGATQDLILNNASAAPEVAEVAEVAEERSVQSLENSPPAAVPTISALSSPYQAGWVKGELYLLRKSSGKIEAVLLDHAKISETLREGHASLTLTPSTLPYVTLENGSLQLIPPEKLPYAENTLITLPYQVSLPLPPAGTLNLHSLRNLAITWLALLMTIMLAGLFILSLLRLSKRKSQFVSSVTHELRTPLTSFQLYAEMLRDDLVPTAEKRHHYLDTLNKEAKRLSHLVENVLAYSQIERGKLHSSTQKLAEILPPIIDRLESRVSQTTATLNVSHAYPTETTLHTDPTAVEQILFNLVDNACKYALDENPTQQLALEIKTEGSQLTISLTDKGSGISKKERHKLFLPFHKSAEKAADTAVPGVGLGLSIAKRQAKLLGGKLTLESAKPTGCKFTLSLKAQ